MIKRAIILILILGGLYWLTTSLRNNPTQTPTDKKTETTEDKKVEDKENATKNNSDVKDSGKDVEKTEEKNNEATTEETKKETPVVTKLKETTTKSESKKEEIKKEVVKVSIPKVIKKTPKVVYPDRTTTVKVYLYEWAVDISKKEIPSGTVAFEVVNNGRFSHNFNIKGIGNFGKVPPRQSANFTAKFLPGSFEIYSDKRDDYENGMKEDITIVK